MKSSSRSRARGVPQPSTSSRFGGRRRASPGPVLAGLGTVWALACAALVAVAVAEEPVRERPLRALTVGIGEDYAKNRRTPDAARLDLDACRRAGASVLRISFSWSEMEPEPGRYDFAFWDKVVPMAVDEYGLRLIPYACYTPGWASSEPDSDAVWTTPPKDHAAFGRFVRALVNRYKRRIRSWEIWNEPDIPEFGTEAESGTAEAESGEAESGTGGGKRDRYDIDKMGSFALRGGKRDRYDIVRGGKRDRYDIDKMGSFALWFGDGTNSAGRSWWNGFSRFKSRRGANAVVRESGRLPSIRAGFAGYS